jgi:chromate transporter
MTEARVEREERRLGELWRFFARLGISAFGGPAAHIALMEHDAVERRGWLTREAFLDLVGACNLLPGPSSTQVAMALGYTRGGWSGLAVAGVCFILPASLATLALAWAYVRYGHLPQVQGILYGAKPVMLAVIVQAIGRLARTALRRWWLAALCVACLAAGLAGVPPLALLAISGSSTAMIAASRRDRASQSASFALVPAAGVAATAAAAPGLLSICLVFLKLGVVVFGSGYVLLAFLQADLVHRHHWLTNNQLLDAVTAGQVTPGPLFATATFLGYLLHGYSGAAVATLAIFLPSFIMAGVVGALAHRMRQSPIAGAFLDGVNAAAIGLMAMVTIALGRATLVDAFTWTLALACAAILVRWRVNATWLLAVGAALGVAIHGWK